MVYFGGNGFLESNNGLAYVIITASLSLAITIVFYVLRSIGIYTLAKKAKIKGALLAFFPCVWLYPTCMLIKETKVFGSTVGKMAVLFTVIFTASEFLFLVSEFISYFPLVGNVLMNKANIYVGLDSEIAKNLYEYKYLSNMGIYVNSSFVDPYRNLPWIENLLMVISSVSMILELASIIITITVYVNLFKKYVPAHFILYAVLSAMGLFGVFVFVIRNKQPIKYMDYIRARYQNFYGAQGPQGGGPYGYYGGNASASSRPDSPFEEFADKKDKRPEEPFSDFENKN